MRTQSSIGPLLSVSQDELTVVAYDRRGTRRSGREDWPGGGSVQHADDAAAPVKALGINRVTDMGFSAGGAAVTLVVGAALVAVSSSLLDGLDIMPETWRIAAGMVATVVGLTVLAFPSRADEPRLPGNRTALVPATFPLLLTPELVAFVSIFGATEPATRSIGGLIAALALGIAAARIGYRCPTLWLAGARFFAALLILSGVAMIVEGIRDV